MSKVTGWLGSLPAIVGSFVIILAWALTGPVFGFSNTWQLMINTATTIITFNMVFVIQNTQNRDGRAMHTKIDALLDYLEIDPAALKGLEDLPERDIRAQQVKVRA
ncbi:MAG: low affinity iron permease family protein [Actinomycetota bacterium]|nr:low affinity iron permease family protein [Actinomycetota bacterium]